MAGGGSAEPQVTLISKTRVPLPDLTWSFVTRWSAPASRGWESIQEWSAAARTDIEKAESELAHRSEAWRDWLAPFPEVSEVDWRNFRPLPLSREEAWSDWVAHLLSSSASGRLAQRLFKVHPEVATSRISTPPAVGREVVTRDGARRADLLLEWPDQVIHLEVKVGDQHYSKTRPTCRKLEEDFGLKRPWADFILVRPVDASSWLEADAQGAKEGRRIGCITWLDLARALRAAIALDAESVPWRAWAHSLCGAVEQRLLGCQPTTARRQGRWTVAWLMQAIAQLETMEGDPE